nr:DoxX family protein [Kineosporia babensis]
MLRDLIVLAARAALGVVFIAHGWQKFSTNGMEATVTGFEGMGIPLPALSAWFTVAVELVGGVLMIAGLGVPLLGLLMAFTMFGAMFLVHLEGGLMSSNGGYEYTLILAAFSLMIAAIGAGRLSVDQVISPRLASGVARVPATA